MGLPTLLLKQPCLSLLESEVLLNSEQRDRLPQCLRWRTSPRCFVFPLTWRSRGRRYGLAGPPQRSGAQFLPLFCFVIVSEWLPTSNSPQLRDRGSSSRHICIPGREKRKREGTKMRSPTFSSEIFFFFLQHL